jgi:hypothetical protein
MIAKPLKIAVLLFATSAGSLCLAQMDVDQADSLNFEAFHKDKKESVKVWKDDKDKKAETVKAYDQNSTTAPATTNTVTPAAATTLTSTPVTSTTPVLASTKPGQRFEIRERYTLTRSAKTPYSAFYVIESLHQQSAKLCPKGWKKLTERSEAVEQDFYLFYEIECL